MPAMLPPGPSGPGRQEYGGMRLPWQGPHRLGASAPGAGARHRCVTRLPGARVAERSDAPGAVGTVRHSGTRRSEDARAQPRPSLLGRGQAPSTAPDGTGLSSHLV